MRPPRLILVAQAAGAFGVKGELRITAFTEDPAALLRYRTLKREDGGPALTLTGGRVAGGALIAPAREGIAAFAGIWWDLGEVGTPDRLRHAR